MLKCKRCFLTAILILFCIITSHNISAFAEDIEKLTVQGENFVNSEGEPIRFWGFNIVSLYPTHKQAENLADMLYSYGVNVVRPHHNTRDAQYNWNSLSQGGSGLGALIKYDYNNKTTRTPNADAYERFDYFNSQLRSKGIYLRLSLDGTRSYLPGDVDILKTNDEDREAWYSAMEVLNKVYWEQARDLRRMLATIDERTALLNEEFMRYFLNHRNPYTNLTYAEDPQVLTLEVANETSAEYAIVVGNRFVQPSGVLKYSDGTPLTDADIEKLQYWENKLMAKWHEYLTSIGLEESEHFDMYSGLSDSSKNSICSDFLRKLDEDYFIRIKKLVREEIGCETPITYSTFWRGENNLKMHINNGDYIEEHTYSDPLTANSLTDLFGTVTQQTRVAGMPYFIGEINQKESLVNVPSRTTLLFASAVYGSFYNWTGINFFAYNHGDINMDSNGNPRQAFRIPDLSTYDSRSDLIGEMEKDSMMLDHMRTTGMIYRNGYIHTSTQKQLNYVDEPYKATSYSGLMNPKYPLKSGWHSVHSMYKAFTESDESIPIKQKFAPWYNNVVESPVVSDTNEIIKDVQKKQLKIQAPQTEGFSGFTYNGELICSTHMECSGNEGSATVLLVSFDGKEISESEHMIISNTALEHKHSAELNNITGTEYGMNISLKGLKDCGRVWQFKVTRPKEHSGTYALQASEDGSYTLPSDVSWNEAEIILSGEQRKPIEYVLTDTDGEIVSGLPCAGGELELSAVNDTAFDDNTVIYAKVDDSENNIPSDIKMLRYTGQIFNTAKLDIPQQEMKELQIVGDETEYHDTEAKPGIEYEYAVQGYSNGEPVGELQQFKEIYEVRAVQPDSVKKLEISKVSSDYVSLVWDYDKVSDIDGYNIYRDGVLIEENITNKAYTDKTVDPGAVYVYEVRAVRGSAESFSLSARVQTPESSGFNIKFYNNGVYGDNMTYNRPDDSAQLVTDTISQEQAVNDIGAGTKVIRFKLNETNGSAVPDAMRYINIIWGLNLQNPKSYSFKDIKEDAVLKLYINIISERQDTQIGFLNCDEYGNVSSVRLSLNEYLTDENLIKTDTDTQLKWYEINIPLNDIEEKGKYYLKDSIIAEDTNEFNWGKVIGVMFAQSNEGNPGHTCRLHDIQLIYDEKIELYDENTYPHQSDDYGINIEWNRIEGADSYKIYRRGGQYRLKLYIWNNETLEPLDEVMEIK